jgi:hypothetical protein
VRARSAAGPVTLVITSSDDAAGSRDRVRPDERDAVLQTLEAAGVAHAHEAELASAVRRALQGWAVDDLVLLLGAQGMDGAAEQARAVLAGR